MELNEAIERVKRQAENYQAVIVVAGALESAANLGQTVAELDVNIKARRGELADTIGRVEQAVVGLSSATAEARQVRLDAKVQAEAIVADAKREKADVLANIEDEILAARERATASAEASLATTSAKISAQREAMVAELKTATSRLEGLQGQIEDAESRAAQIEKAAIAMEERLAAAKARAAEILA